MRHSNRTIVLHLQDVQTLFQSKSDPYEMAKPTEYKSTAVQLRKKYCFIKNQTS